MCFMCFVLSEIIREDVNMQSSRYCCYKKSKIFAKIILFIAFLNKCYILNLDKMLQDHNQIKFKIETKMFETSFVHRLCY